MRRLPLILSMITLVMLSTYIVPVSAQGTATPRLLREIGISNSRHNKFPTVTTSGQTVFIGGNVSLDGGRDTTDAFVWAFPEQATSIGAGFNLGSADGKADYSTVGVGTAPDGTIYAAWTNVAEERVYLRHRASDGSWGPRYLVTAGNYPVFPKVAIDTAGKVFVTWQEPGMPQLLRVSSNQGASWSEKYSTAQKTYTLNNTIAAGPNGQVVIGFATKNLEAAVAIWTGSGLSTELLTDQFRSGGVSTSIGWDGTIYAAWRGLDATGDYSGVYYAQRQSANRWATVHLGEGDVKNLITIVADSGGALHLGWNAMKSGSPRFYYALREVGSSTFSKAVPASPSPVYNSHLAVSSGGTFAQAALEDGSGGPTRITYARFSGSTGGFSATPVIEGGAATVGGTGKIAATVTFKDLIGVTASPATVQVRWHWDSAPTDANMTDSLGSGVWKTFPNPVTGALSVPIPSALLSSTSCAESVLYTQIRDTTRSLLESSPKRDAILVDGVVQSSVIIENPLIHTATTALSADLALNKGAIGAGDPRYTRVSSIYLSAVSSGDCAGLASVSLGSKASAMESTYKGDSTGYSGLVSLPDLANLTTGKQSVYVQVRDLAGNATPSQLFTITYDDVAPVLVNDGSPVAAENPDATIFQDLTFTDAQVTDDLYTLDGTDTGRQFWGVWIANSLTEVTTQAGLDALKWAALPAPGPNGSFTIKNWSLASGLASVPAAGKATDVHIYVRFLDGAGNATIATPAHILVNSTFTRTDLWLPVVRR